MEELQKKIQKMQSLQNEVAGLEELLKEKKKALERVSGVEIPELLEGFGLSELKLSDGSSVTITQEYHLSNKKEHDSDFFNWLKSIGEEGIVKNEVMLPTFDDGESNQVYDVLVQHGFNPTIKKTIHAGTKKAWARQQSEKGTQFPEFCNLFIKKTTKIK